MADRLSCVQWPRPLQEGELTAWTWAALWRLHAALPADLAASALSGNNAPQALMLALLAPQPELRPLLMTALHEAAANGASDSASVRVALASSAVTLPATSQRAAIVAALTVAAAAPSGAAAKPALELFAALVCELHAEAGGNVTLVLAGVGAGGAQATLDAACSALPAALPALLEGGPFERDHRGLVAPLFEAWAAADARAEGDGCLAAALLSVWPLLTTEERGRLAVPLF